MADTRVVLIAGARQSGKTTLVRSFADNRSIRYLSLDESVVLDAARRDPPGFIRDIAGAAIIDEIQHAPDLFPAIKIRVDQSRAAGQFLLTGSANVLLLPKLSESLAGRIEILTLWPLSQSEIAGVSTNVPDALFAASPPRVGGPITRAEAADRIARGGYPEVLDRNSHGRRKAWFDSYLTTILQRDVREIADIEGLTAMPRLLALLAARCGSLLNIADLSRDAELPYNTLRRYLALLEWTYLFVPLPSWHANVGLRFSKAPKVHLNDTGLAASLLGLDSASLAAEGRSFGSLLESLVAMGMEASRWMS
jgi:uncharacterized protein